MNDYNLIQIIKIFSDYIKNMEQRGSNKTKSQKQDKIQKEKDSGD